MSLRRLHAPDLPEQGGEVVLDEAQSQHVRVLRLRPGDEIELFDGRGACSKARIESIEGSVRCHAEPLARSELRRSRVVLMLALPKGSTLDDCIRMATELGVDEIALMSTARTVPHWTAERAASRIERLTRIAAESSAQCERKDIPVIHGPKPCDAWLERIPEGARRVVFGARAGGRLELDETTEQVWCAVGPEGGFSDEELSSFEAAGFSVASLGPSVLRVDTAVAAALTLVQDRRRQPQPR